MRIKHKTPKLLTMLILSAIMLWYGSMVAAQGGPVQWTTPVNLSNTPTRSDNAVVVADSYGHVHLFWTEDVDGSAILYRRWDGKTWTEAVDLFFTSSLGNAYKYPIVAIDEDDTLYLTWNSNAGVHFSSAPAHAAISAGAWLPDTIITPARGFRAALLARGQGKLDVVYSAFRQPGYKDGNIYHVRSTDGGLTWSEPGQISEVYPNTETLAAFPRLAADARGRLHVAWYETDPPSYIGTNVFYARSIDGGDTWSPPLKLEANLGPEATWASATQVAAVGDDEVHLTWVCGEKPGRCHQWSTDGGATWTPARHLFGDLHSLAAWDAITVDPATGIVYWIVQLRYPEAIYYTYWDGDRWVDPPLPIDGLFLPDGHAPHVAIGRGNQLNLVVQHQTIFEIWYYSGISTLASAQEPKPTPTVLPTATPTPGPTATPIVIPTPTRQIKHLPTTDQIPVANDQGQATGVLFGILPVALLIGFVILYTVLVRRD